MKGIKENFALSSIVTVFNKPFNFFDGYINEKSKTCGLSMKYKPYYIKLYFTTTTLFWCVYYKATLAFSFVKTVRFIVL